MGCGDRALGGGPIGPAAPGATPSATAAARATGTVGGAVRGGGAVRWAGAPAGRSGGLSLSGWGGGRGLCEAGGGGGGGGGGVVFADQSVE